MPAVDLITMGCSKNLVDSERLLFRLKEAGYRVYHNPHKLHHDVAIVNTCGFITDAKAESIEMILKLVDLKNDRKLKKVLVMGCLSERFYKELNQEIPGVDRYYGKFNWENLVDDLLTETTATRQRTNQAPDGRLLTTSRHYAYIKISEGCDRHCAYCAIPLMTGRHKSRPIEDILREMEKLVCNGVHEFQIIAQELTYYGLDLYKERKIAELVEQMAGIRGVRWIRLHYAYPNDFPMDLLRVMRDNPNVCRYLDIALQHASDRILDRMQRHITNQQQRSLINTIRQEVPGIAIRTTFMVGFPGETDQDFEELLSFVKEMRFERMGAFTYSEEEGTAAARLYTDDVPEEVKQSRLDKLMAVQQGISEEIMATRVDNMMPVVVSHKEGDYYIGRTEFDSPEVDGVVFISVPKGKRLLAGHIYDVSITDSNEFDLYGQLAPQ